MKLSEFNGPKTREEFERNFHILSEQIQNNKFHIDGSCVQTFDSLLKIRYLPNGRINFLTVDEGARLTANMSGSMFENMHFPMPIGEEEED